MSTRERGPSTTVLLVLAGLAVAAGVGLRVWAALQGGANLDSDEAIFGLMALHVLDGDVPAFMYGQRYLGTVEAILGAGWMALLGEGVVASRLGAISIFAVFLAVHGIVVRRHFGGVAAVASLFVLALPGFHMLWLTFRPVAAFPTMLLLGTLVLLLTDLRGSGPKRLALGAVMGIGAWTHPLTLVYPAAIGIVRLTGTPEWRRVRERIGRWSSRLSGAAGLLPGLLVAGGAAAAAVLVFSGGCPPGSPWTSAYSAARLALPLLALGVGGAVLLSSDRRLALLRLGLPLLGGVVLGSAPAWAPWLLGGAGAPTSGAVTEACLRGVLDRTRLVAVELLPALLTGPHRSEGLAWPHTLLVVPAGAAVWFAVRHRRTLSGIVTLRPIGTPEQAPATWSILLAVPAVLAALSTNTFDIWSTRYLVITWHAVAVLIGVAVARLTRYRRPLGALVLTVWLAVVTLVGVRDVRGALSRSRAPAGSSELEAVEVALERHGTGVGYADYWDAYRLDLLWGEDPLLTPFREGSTRYPPYAEVVAGSPTFAVVVPASRGVAEDIRTGAELAAAIGLVEADGPAATRIASAEILAHEATDGWDVWILRDP